MPTAHRFASVPDSALDNIMRLDEMFRADRHPDKLNLIVGVYQTAEGTSPILDVVKEAERRLMESETSKNYVPMAGEASYFSAVEKLVFGEDSSILSAGRVGSLHTVGGTGALRLAAEFVAENLTASTLWLGEPAYPNHRGIFGALKSSCRAFPYFDVATGLICEEEMFAALSEAKAGDIVLVHGCCHNPSGADLSRDGWLRLARFMSQRGLIPFVDLAYLGFADGIEQDAQGVRALFELCSEGIVTTSFSKNFALYNERAGVLSIVAGNRDAAQRCMARARTYVRRLYTSPPAHGGRIIATVLADPGLRQRWANEVEEMRQRLVSVRRSLHDVLAAHQLDLSLFPGLTTLKGLFALSRLTEAHVDQLRLKHHVYMLPNGRISISGLADNAMERLAHAIADVTHR
jgi:aspartate aminotransferase